MMLQDGVKMNFKKVIFYFVEILATLSILRDRNQASDS